MNALDLLVLILKCFEGCSLKAYKDIVGVWTIGYGETLGVHEGMVWTQEQADNQLRQRAGHFLLKTLKACPQLHLESDQRVIACASLAYNIGTGAFSVSSVCRNTKRRQYQSAANSFWLWNKAGGRVVRGLTIRRDAERRKYLE